MFGLVYSKKTNMFYPQFLIAKTFIELNFEFILITFLTLIFVVPSSAGCEYKNDLKVDELQIGNMISWTTVIEDNADKFIIQKSKEGIDFEIVGEIGCEGNSTVEKNYRYLDTSLGEEKAFYRLVQVDKNGAENFTPTVLINRNMTNNFVITGMSSTQTDGIFSFSLRSNLEGNLAMKTKEVADDKIVDSKYLPIVKGLNVLTIDIENYSNGVYKIEFNLVGEKESITVEKVNSDKVPNVSYVVKK